ncbi:DUF4097 domain-containing protein [Fructilactobacillus myrtifloralis]|uniref:DUF4097 domain-containing protein n=1 Tax=Fructilactobacillus myrtifloralis TaxID=2940301 RepID=A0ABY5BLX0_9LACO|nr:DUF4097 family beta strand repeat-containing protein [Fructilactobacillus myrtifloralis]USS84675.1 DUF4097 domain-containing protein [Fructilactobacillus myrtifloralis]
MLRLFLAVLPAAFTPQATAASQTQKVKNTAQLDTLKINVPAQVTVKSGNEFTVQSNFRDQQKPKVTKNGDNIEVNVKDQKLWDQINHSHSGKLKHKVVITLPQVINPKTVKINSGTLDFKTTTPIQNFQANSNAWNMTISKANFKQSKLVSSSGDVNSNDSQIGTTMIKSESGDVSLRNTKLQATQIESEGGNVLLEKVDSNQPLKINSSSGDITMKQPNLTKVTLSSDGGDIKTHDLIAKDLNFNSGAGDVAMDNQKSITYDQLQLKSDSGDVQIKNAKINHSKINADAGDISLKHVNIKHKDN